MECNVAQQLNNNTVIVRATSPFVNIIDLADIHRGAKLSNKKNLKTMVSLIAETENLYVIGGGDGEEHATTTSKSSLMDEECHGADQVEELADILQPIAKKILFIKDGNHGSQRSLRHDNMAPERLLAKILGIKYIRGIGIALINVNKNLYSIAAIHTPRKTEATFDWLPCDAFFIEHQHTKYTNRLPIPYLNRTEHKWATHDRLYLRSGSFLDWGGYAMENYRPLLSEGSQILRLSGEKNKWDMRVYERVKDFKEDMEAK